MNIKNILKEIGILTGTSFILSTSIASEQYLNEITKLEKSIIKKIKTPYKKISNYYQTKTLEIPLNDSLYASIIIEDRTKNETSPDTFQLAIAKRGTTIEWYVDNGLDGLKQNDEYHCPEPKISNTIGSYRFNRIPRMNTKQVKTLNKQYIQRLKQVNNALTK